MTPRMTRRHARLWAFLFAATVAAVPLIGAGVANAGGEDQPHKVYVCKMVGTPGVDERLQTGQNPIDVDVHAIPEDPVVVGSYFADAQGRSYVLAFDVGQPEPDVSECPGGPPPSSTTTSTASTTSSTSTSTTGPEETTTSTTSTTEPSTTTSTPESTTTTTEPVTTTSEATTTTQGTTTTEATTTTEGPPTTPTTETPPLAQTGTPVGPLAALGAMFTAFGVALLRKTRLHAR